MVHSKTNSLRAMFHFPLQILYGPDGQLLKPESRRGRGKGRTSKVSFFILVFFNLYVEQLIFVVFFYFNLNFAKKNQTVQNGLSEVSFV